MAAKLTSEKMSMRRGKLELFGPKTSGWLPSIRSHKYPYTCGASSVSSQTGNQESHTGITYKKSKKLISENNFYYKHGIHDMCVLVLQK